MATRSIAVVTVGILFVLVPFTLVAQVQRDAVPLKSWPAPLYWQPNISEDVAIRAKLNTSGEARFATSAGDVTSQGTTPAGALIFVAMTPCRVVDTRTGAGFSGAF